MELVRREGMMDRIQTGDSGTVWVQPDVTAEQIEAYHAKGKAVTVDFSANGHEMDLPGMKAAVAAGADGLFVDCPRLGADAVGRPVESRLSALAAEASAGESSARAKAILELSRYRGFPLQQEFAHWLLDPDDHVLSRSGACTGNRAAADPVRRLRGGLRSDHPDARANAAWALGVLRTPDGAALLLLQDLLRDKDPACCRKLCWRSRR